MTQDEVVSLIVDMMGVTIKVALPMLMMALIVGLVISVLQAVTQIQEQTLSFIPKIIGLVAVIAIAGPWMLGTVVERQMPSIESGSRRPPRSTASSSPVRVRSVATRQSSASSPAS